MCSSLLFKSTIRSLMILRPESRSLQKCRFELTSLMITSVEDKNSLEALISQVLLKSLSMTKSTVACWKNKGLASYQSKK